MTIHPAPKPSPTEKKARKPLRAKTPLRSSSVPTRTAPMKKKTALRKVNTARIDKRTKAYRAYIASPEWKRLRAACLARDAYTCQVCGYQKGPGLDLIGDVIEDRQLHCAHLTYARFGHELLEDVITKCHDCHLNKEHGRSFIQPRHRRAG